jgi:Fe-S cluster assembly scaffold protein SufB
LQNLIFGTHNQDLYYYSAPKRKALASLDEVDPEILKTYAKLGIPLREQEMLAGVEREDGTRSRVAVDAVLRSTRTSKRCFVSSRLTRLGGPRLCTLWTT